ncbi:endolytic transglycosylase MltG [soil metagenome]
MPQAPEPIDEIVDMPRERAGLPKLAVVLGLILVLFGGLVVGGRSWWQRQVDPPGPPGEQVSIVVPSGARLTDLGSLLGDADVVANATLFRFWIRDKDIDLKAGTYVFRRSSSFEEVEEVLRGNPLVVATTDLAIPEGFTLDQIIARYPEAVPRFTPDEVLAAIADPANRSRFLPPDQPSLEGMMFPSTYEVGPNDTASTMVRRMVDEMDRQAVAAGIDVGLSGDNLPQLNAYEIITVASLIERETGNPQESPQIARVIYNRLLDGTPLGIDATSRYEADRNGTEEIDFESDSPYNTRTRPGLPPTPIASPGRASLDAALNPATGDELYYVLEAEDRHFFTSSYDEFLAKKDECEAKGLGCG